LVCDIYLIECFEQLGRVVYLFNSCGDGAVFV
jgi:hypothetical protein